MIAFSQASRALLHDYTPGARLVVFKIVAWGRAKSFCIVFIQY